MRSSFDSGELRSLNARVLELERDRSEASDRVRLLVAEVVSICGEMTTMQLVCNLSISRCSLERKRFVEIEKITVAA